MFPRPDRIIVAQYERPAGLSLIACAELLGDSKRAIAAQVVDLAVRKVVSIAEVPGRRRTSRSGFTLVLGPEPAPDGSTAQGADEREVLQVLFGHNLEPGSRIDIAPGRNRRLGADLRHPHRSAVARLVTGDLVRVRSFAERVVVFWRKQPTVPTARAAASIDHLWGVRDYIAWAEKDRLAFLQSPQGAERQPTVRGDLEVIRLHEKLLPFALLFGLERQWLAELDLRYRELGPEFGDAMQTLSDVGDVAVVGIEVIALAGDLTDLVQLADLTTITDFGEAADGIGAIFGGLAEFLGGLN